MVGYVKIEDTLGLKNRLNNNTIRLSGNFRFVKFLYGLPNEKRLIPIYTIKSNRQNKATITEKEIIDARQDYDFTNSPVVTMQMNEKGSIRWERMTGEASKEKTQIAMVVNDIVFSVPGVNNGAIHEGSSQISGDFSRQEALELATIISSKSRIPQLKLIKYTKQS